MAITQAENVVDFVNDTLKDLGKPKFTDISSNLQEHVAMGNVLRKNRVVLESGGGIQFNVLVGQSNAARNVSLGQSDNVNQVDGMVQASTVWRNSQTSYQVIRQLMEMNREPARIVDFVKQQRLMALISLAELMESNFWGAPNASDATTPYGVPYFCVKNATAGFNGGNATGFSSVYGISNSTYPNWANYTYPYVNATRDDLIRAARKAMTLIGFKPATDGIPSPNTGDDYGHYAPYGVIGPLEEALEAQNDNLGSDIASQDGKVMLRRRPVTWVPWLERDTTLPLYSFNWGWLKTCILSGEWLRETPIVNTPGQHTVSSYFIDLTYNFVSKNRRCHAVGSNGTTAF